jgi:hypothetical protein
VQATQEEEEQRRLLEAEERKEEEEEVAETEAKLFSLELKRDSEIARLTGRAPRGDARAGEGRH